MSNTESVQPKEEEKEEVAPEVNEKEKSNMKITIIPTVIVDRNIDTKESKDSESIEKETPQGPEKKNEIENKVKNNEDLMKYIINMVNMFEIYSHMGLFGIDIIIENDNLFIIDANSLPGYKNGFDVEKDLRNYLKEIIT
jgi:hypothetical protein